jgi:hypothetical protein
MGMRLLRIFFWHRRATRALLLLAGVTVAAPAINFVWPHAVHDVIADIRSTPTTTTTLPTIQLEP